MGKYIAFGMLITGVGSLLYQWVQQQQNRQRRVEAFVVFLQKSLYAMEQERIRLIPYLMNYESGDRVVNAFLKELGKRLSENQYPHGELAWREVFFEHRKDWDCDETIFDLLLNASYGFFSGSRKENLCFLQKSIRQLEVQLEKNKEKDIQERKVWLPVGMLGSIMLMILLM